MHIMRVMLVQHFEPRGRRFTNVHDYYAYDPSGRQMIFFIFLFRLNRRGGMPDLLRSM